ncbi:MAG: phytanoyl-CoA dioxygenase [Rhodospirillaceae bacterium]|nr:phytanoyl-CoA dioxygenase [Rhodospirillaceae bacterium]
MTPEEILSHPARVLSEAQRETYFQMGFLVAEGLITTDWVKRLNQASTRFLDASRTVANSDEVYDIGPNHSPESPHVRRLRALVDRAPIFWEFACASLLPDIAADLVGPDVKFHSSKLNYKWPGGNEVVKWHQDIPAWPHTNYSPVTLGVHLDAVTAELGPLVCVPKSHDGPLFVHRSEDGNWTGSISEKDLSTLDLSSGIEANGPAGTVVAINCRTIHGSASNTSDQVRALPLYVYSSADAFAWMPPPSPTTRTGEIVRGNSARVTHVDPRRCPVPPDWSKIGYGSIFTAQQQQ